MNQRSSVIWAMIVGLTGVLMLAALYFAIVSIVQSPAHAVQQFWQDRLLVIPIMAGFGVQVALYTYMKIAPMPVHAPASGATTAAGGGVSGAAMAACCAHHVADVLPLFGLTAAATFVANWRVPFMVVALLTNAIGIALMLRALRQRRRTMSPPAVTQPSTGVTST